MAATDVFVYNGDVVGLYNRINRFIEEAQKSVSADVSLTNSFDITRLNSYLDSVDRFQAWVVSQPLLDLPETSPRQYTLFPAIPAVEIENDDLDDIVRLLRLARDEMTNSQSARLSSGLIAPDSSRLTMIIAKTRKFLNDYIVPTQPLDLPESSPRDLMTGSGKIGV